MPTRQIWSRLSGYYRRRSASLSFKNTFLIRATRPIISFTFDDFPRSALQTGGGILKQHELRGTYYTSLGLMGKQSPSGIIFDLSDLRTMVDDGHELGCHTYSHCDAWQTDPITFERSVLENRAMLSRLVPTAEFKTLSYPISPPRPLTKRRAARHFACCRGGGQTFNTGMVDLNQLSAFFLEKTHENIQTVRLLIKANRDACGWLIFATHDVSESPSPFGVTPGFFEAVVQESIKSGAQILPVYKALVALRGTRAAEESDVNPQLDRP